MKPTDIERMANQIAGFFSAYPDEEAVPAIADHFAKFWEPRMRSDLAALAAREDHHLNPLVIEAVRSLRSASAV